MVWDDNQLHKNGNNSLGAIPSFAAEMAAVKARADCPGASKKL